MNELLAIVALIGKDIGVWRRQPALIIATILPALALFLVIYFSAAAVGRNPIALVVLGHGPHTRQLISILEDSEAFVVHEATAGQSENELKNLDVAAVVTIPANFDAAYDTHQPDPVTIRINNLNLDFTNDLRRSLPAAITQFFAEQKPKPVAVQVQETDMRGQDIGLIQFELIPNLVLLLTIAGVFNAGLATAREWEDLTITELLAAPISRTSLIAGKLLAGWITALLVAGVVLVLGAVSGFLRPQGLYWVPTLAVVALLALASAGLGVALWALLRRFQPVAAIGINVAFYLFFLSGGISVAAFLPDWVQSIADFIPTFYGVHALQTAFFYSSTDQFGRDVAVLVATAAVTLVLGVLSLRKSTLA